MREDVDIRIRGDGKNPFSPVRWGVIFRWEFVVCWLKKSPPPPSGVWALSLFHYIIISSSQCYWTGQALFKSSKLVLARPLKTAGNFMAFFFCVCLFYRMFNRRGFETVWDFFFAVIRKYKYMYLTWKIIIVIIKIFVHLLCEIFFFYFNHFNIISTQKYK